VNPVFAAHSLMVALAVLAMAQTAQGPDTSTRSIIKAAAGYVAEYQPQLTSIVADEVYTQEIVSQSPRDAQMPRIRQMRSEVFFMFAPATNDWMAIRDVLVVDGDTLRDRPDLREALQLLPARDVAAKFKEYNSRYNIGRTYRNFNEPTLTLLVLDARHRARFSFDRKRIERTGDTVLVTIAFSEKESPTLIHDPRRGRVFSKGELTVEAGAGRVRRTLLTAKTKDVRLELTTMYSADERLGIWVPALFREEYEHGVASSSKEFDSSSEHERISCEARYSNFRRFETSVRIK
jgi:hypothetical protein